MLISALAEGEIHVPRLGRIPAAAGFRLIAAMNPFDAVGTARVGQAIYDRMCRIAIGYQDGRASADRRARDRAGARSVGDRRGRSRGAPASTPRCGWAPRCAARSTSSGSAESLAALRGEAEPVPGDPTFADAAIAALSGRLRVEEGTSRRPRRSCSS